MVEPVAIEHLCEELWFGDRLGERHNFLEYIFEDARARILARAYLSEIERVTIANAFLKTSDSSPPAEIDAPELRAGARAYLRRRYLRVEPDDPPQKAQQRR